MSEIYVVEYHELDSLNRQKGSTHYLGAFRTLDDVEVAKKKVLENGNEAKVEFTIYPTTPISSLFTGSRG